MTTTTKKTFIVRYPVTTYHVVEVERDADISEDALLSSITRKELGEGEHQDDCGWDSVKTSWRDKEAEVYVYDEDDCYEPAEFA